MAMTRTGELLSMGVAELLEMLQSLRFHARRLADDRPDDWDLTRATDTLDDQIDELAAVVVPHRYRDHQSLTFRVKPRGQDHRVVVTRRGRDAVVVVDDATGAATLGLVAADYPHIVVALRRWADRVEANYTE